MNNHPSLNLLDKVELNDMNFFYSRVPKELKSQDNFKYFSDFTEAYDLLAQKNHEKVVEKICDLEKMNEEIEDFEFYNFGGKN